MLLGFAIVPLREAKRFLAILGQTFALRLRTLMPSFNPTKYFWDWEFMGKISEMVRRGGAEAGKRSGLETQDVL